MASSSDAAGSVGVWSLAVIAFFWVSGGVYGNETLLQAAPPAHVFTGLLIVPLVYSLPIALITAELSSALPQDGGFVVWVSRACGSAIGSHNAYWVRRALAQARRCACASSLWLTESSCACALLPTLSSLKHALSVAQTWIIWLVDSSVYPVLAGHFVARQFGISGAAQALVADAIIFCLTLVKLAGTRSIVKLSSFISTVSFLPTIIYMVLGMSELKPERAAVSSGETDWPLLLSWMLWLYSGFFSLGSLAGQVERPQRTYTRVTALLIPTVTLLNAIPLLVSLSVDDDRSHYTPGHFNDLAGVVGGAWLQKCFFVAANLCQVGLYTGQSLTSERALAHLVENAAGHDSVVDAVLRLVPDKILEENPDAGIAPAYVVANALLAGMLAWVPVQSLVQYEMMLMSCTGMLFLYSFVHLKRFEPSLTRPFKLTKTVAGAVVWVVAPGLLTAANLLIQLAGPGYRSHVPGFLIVIAAGLLAHAGWWWDQRRRRTRRTLFSRMRQENLEDLEEAAGLIDSARDDGGPSVTGVGTSINAGSGANGEARRGKGKGVGKRRSSDAVSEVLTQLGGPDAAEELVVLGGGMRASTSATEQRRKAALPQFTLE